MPTIYQWEEFVDAVAERLMSFGPSILEAYKMAGEYVARILQEKMAPGDIPCSEPSEFKIHVNIVMAQKLGITVPATLNGQPVRGDLARSTANAGHQRACRSLGHRVGAREHLLGNFDTELPSRPSG